MHDGIRKPPWAAGYGIASTPWMRRSRADGFAFAAGNPFVTSQPSFALKERPYDSEPVMPFTMELTMLMMMLAKNADPKFVITKPTSNSPLAMPDAR